jgi:hypothetical protein
LPNYQKAAALQGVNMEYAFAYAKPLQGNNQLEGAELEYKKVLTTFREAGDQSGEAVTLNNLAVLYRQTQCMSEAEDAY